MISVGTTPSYYLTIRQQKSPVRIDPDRTPGVLPGGGTVKRSGSLAQLGRRDFGRDKGKGSERPHFGEIERSVPLRDSAKRTVNERQTPPN